MDYYPDVNVGGGYANQTDASYIQPNFTYLGITANYTFWEWGKKNDVVRQRHTDIALANQNLQVIQDKIQLEAPQNIRGFRSGVSGLSAGRRNGSSVPRRGESSHNSGRHRERKAATAKAQLEFLKAEITCRVANAQLMRHNR